MLHREIECVQKGGFVSAKQTKPTGIIEGAHSKAAPFETWNATKPPLINHEAVDKNAFKSAERLPFTPKLSTKSLKISRVFVSNDNPFGV